MDQPRIAKGKLASPKLVDQTLRTANRLLRLRDFTSSHQLKMADDTSEHDLLGGAIRIQVGDLQAVIAVAGFTEPQNEALALVAASWLDMIPSSNVLRVMHLSGNTEVESVFQLIEATKAA